jgi:hypothetical protein
MNQTQPVGVEEAIPLVIFNEEKKSKFNAMQGHQALAPAARC